MTSAIERIIELIIILGTIAPLVRASIKWLSPKIKYERVKLLESYALRVVNSIEQASKALDVPGNTKRDMAFMRLSDYINKTNLNYNVSPEDIYDLIEHAVNKMNNGVK